MVKAPKIRMKQIKHISYSYLHSFTCPYAAFLRYEASIKSPTTEYLALGNALHLALEESHKAPEGFILSDSITRFRNEFKRILIDDDVFVSWPKQKKLEAEGVEVLELYDYGITEGKINPHPFAVEKEFRLPFEEEIVIVGKIDKVEFDGENYTVIDYKSGSKEPDAWFLSHDLQFTAYAWACLELYGKLPTKMIWHHLRNGKQIETTRTMEDIADLQTLMHNALLMNSQGIRHRVFHQQVCGWCSFAGHGDQDGICDDKHLEKELVEKRDALLSGVS